MLRKPTTQRILTWLLVIACAGPALAAQPAGLARNIECPDAVEMQLDQLLYIEGKGDAGAQTFLLELPSAGIGIVDVVASESRLLLTPVQGDCADSAAESESPTIFDLDPSQWLFEVREPGSYLFRVTSQDPLQLPPWYALTARFVSLAGAGLDQQLRRDSTR